MKPTVVGLIVWTLSAAAADAALLSRAGGQAYYDDVLNVTWLADANYAQTSGHDGDGVMSWAEAQSWIVSLNAANHLGANDWRLPVTVQPDPSCSFQAPGVSSDRGCTASEMGHLYNVDGITAATPGPFTHVREAGYWSGTTFAPDASKAWVQDFYNGLQYGSQKTNPGPAWAVRTGDISAVPAPGTLSLLGTAAAAAGVRLRRRTGS
jgi:hypothetical protein